MKFTIRYSTILLTLYFAMTAMAQDLNTGYFSDGFLYRHDMNPAFENENNYISVPLIGNLNIFTKGDFGYGDVVKKNPLYPDRSDKKMTTFINPYIDSPLDGFSTNDNRLIGQAKLTLMSAGFKAFGGYNTVELNSRAEIATKVPYDLLRFACDIDNNRYDIGSIKADAIGFTELSLGHSRNLNEKLRMGAKLKILMGLGNASVKMNNVTANLQDANTWTLTAEAESHVSMKGFEYESNTKEYNASESEYSYVRDVHSDKIALSGLGLAADLGFVYKIDDNFTLSGALLDLGFISWNNDYYAKNTSEQFTFGGFHDVSIKKDNQDNLEWQTDRYTDQMLDFAHLTDQGDQGGRTTGLGATLNVGVSYILPSYKPLKLGFLGTQRINGDYSWTEGRFVANLTPVKWFDAALSLAASRFAFSIGWMANVNLKGCSFFVGMDNLMGECSKELIPLNSNASFSMGLNVTW